ncbi:rod-binding protein [uncultured Maricaulis sp.]|uniref:rod-binding protein n=1 Tax=uncultured Maricaulis sp. TaxID=174710 RepID=UPI0030D79E20|tara:strand:+ start:1980 stop:2324 length:345 start_codon:yes stop_codon:yes gene_type:complete
MESLLDLQLNQALGASRSGNLTAQTSGTTADAARAAAEDFESVFLAQMMEAMFAQVGEDNPFGGGPGENAFRGMLNEEYAKVMAQAGGIGLSDRLTSEILRYQEAADSQGGESQ